MTKYRIILEVETRPHTKAELTTEGVTDEIEEALKEELAESEDEGLDIPETAIIEGVFDRLCEPIEPNWLADAIVDLLPTADADELIFGGSDLFHKIVTARCIEAIIVPDDAISEGFT